MSAKKGKWTERFNQKNDFDFTVSRVGITVSEAQKIARSFNTLADHVCMITLIEE